MKKIIFGLLALLLIFPGCGKNSNAPGPQRAATAPAEEPLPELQQNKIEPFNIVTPESPDKAQVYTDHPDDNQPMSEEEKKLLLPPATD